MKLIFFIHDCQDDPEPRRQVLESSGYSVRSFSSGSEALEALSVDQPDAVVMDILLDGPNGFEVCRSIRARHPAGELPVILCSAVYRKRVFKEEAWDAGAQGYLLKPVDPDDLVQHVNSACSRKPAPKLG